MDLWNLIHELRVVFINLLKQLESDKTVRKFDSLWGRTIVVVVYAEQQWLRQMFYIANFSWVFKSIFDNEDEQIKFPWTKEQLKLKMKLQIRRRQ